MTSPKRSARALADRGQAGSRLAARKHLPDHVAVSPIMDRTLLLTGFQRRLTPDELPDAVQLILPGRDHERITSVGPRARTVPRWYSMAPPTATLSDSPRSMAPARRTRVAPPASRRSSSWNLPVAKHERRRGYIVRASESRCLQHTPNCGLMSTHARAASSPTRPRYSRSTSTCARTRRRSSALPASSRLSLRTGIVDGLVRRADPA